MKRILFSGIFSLMLALALLAIPSPAKADSYVAYAGAETKDQSVQADGFFPNELWVLEGDSITWTFIPKNEPHTVTFLTPNQVRPQAPPPVGPPFGAACTASTGSASYNGSACVSSNPVNGGLTFKVTFPTAGNYKLVCLVHTDMNGTVHVLDPSDPASAGLVHSQRFYDDQAAGEALALLSDDHQGEDDRGWEDRHNGDNEVLAGNGKILATAGGLEYRAVVRFQPEAIQIRAGESVLWTNLDPTEPHTITFGSEPPNFVPTLYSLPPALTYPMGAPILTPPVPCSSTVTTNCKDPDTGTVIATVNCTTTPTNTAGTTPCDAAFDIQENSVNPPPPSFEKFSYLTSGFVQAAAPDRIGSPQLPPGTTRIRITFPNKGTYYYHCALHDVDGMYGVVIVK